MRLRRQRRGPRSAGERVERLLVMLPWILERRQVRLADMAKQFRLSEKELMDDLMMVSMCGVPPYTPDALIDVRVDEEWVIAEVPNMFRRPLQLTSAEVFVLSAMRDAAMRIPGADRNGPLASALDKLKPLLPKDDAGVTVDLRAVRYLEELRDALDRGAEVKISYFTPSTASRSERNVVPRRILESFGNWYVQGDDSASGEMRTFRIDRIDALDFTGRTVPVIEMDDDEETWFADATEFVTMSVASKARWIVEQYPYVSREESADGRIVVKMAVTSEHWLGRLLLRAGTNASVIEPAKWSDLGAQTARSVLARYGG